MNSLITISKIFSSFDEAIYIVDKTRKIVYFNPIAEKITGFSSNEIVGKHCFDNILNHIDSTGKNLCINGCPLLKTINENIVVQDNVFLHHKDGHRIPVYVKTIPYIEDNILLGAVELFSTKIEREMIDKENIIKENLSMIDPLTGLLNRNFLSYRVHELISKQDSNYAVLFLDIDDFKTINDNYGHLVGDKVLEIVSTTILANTTNDDFVIRFGGEEIIIFLKTPNLETAFRKAEQLRIVINASEERNIRYRPKVTIGVSMYDKKLPLNTSIELADKAMYYGKQKGKNQVSFNY
ncbi:sensor domain-containing diguanylate cyclase [Haploplasma axanthum]|nr:sensor domain-containing diguanylate cyclase [Haploplasma axanthum]